MSLPERITAASLRIREGRSTPSSLLDGCLKQIASLENRINAWVLVDEDHARRTAEELNREVAEGRLRGPLHGIPIGIKDIIDVRGLPTLAGSRIRDGHVASEDAEIVARLREAGAVILGKTVTTQFACFDPPPTRNPWNLNHTPGGSSSGSAAAVATGMCLGAIGSQTGGSLGRPASYCGIASFKPSYGRVSMHGIVPVAFSLDVVGPMAHTMADLAVMMDVMAGFDRKDPISVQTEWHGGQRDESAPVLGWCESFFMENADEDVEATTRVVMRKLQEAGAKLVPIRLPDSFSAVHAMHMQLMRAEAAMHHKQTFPSRRNEYAPGLASMLEEGNSISAPDYAEARRHQVAFRRAITEALAPVEALLTPATHTVAPARLDTTGNPKFNIPWSFSGLPAATFPCALNEAGMPMAIQLAGAPFSDPLLIKVAAWCESVVGFGMTAPCLALKPPSG